MPSTFSPLKIQLMATGENNTTWGDVTNLNLGTALEEAIVGSADVTFASADVTLTLTDTNASQTARNMRLRCTGTTGGSTRNLIVPSIEKPYIVKNDCADSVVVKTAAGTGITVPAGKTMWVYTDATNVVDAVTHLSSLTLSTPLPVSSGGTGVNTSLTAGSVVFAGASGAYSQDNANFFWDDTNNRLGIGTNTPLSALDVIGNIRIPSTNSLYWAGGNELITAVENNRMAFWVNAAERMRIDSSGNVGIGTSSPGSKLEVVGNYRQKAASGNINGFNVTIDVATDVVSLTNYYNAALAFGTNNTERMRIDASGNVGIGTSSPSTIFDVLGVFRVRQSANAADVLGKSDNTGGLNLFGGGAFNAGAGILIDGTSSATPNIIRFTRGAFSESMRIDASGNVGIGVNVPDALLNVNGGISVGVAGFSNTAFGQRFWPVVGGNSVFNIYAGVAKMHFTTGASNDQTANSSLMVITNNGDVGIGTSSPIAKLDVVGAANTYARINDGTVNLVLQSYTAGSSGLIGTTSNHPLTLWSNAAERMRITSIGDIGIGTSSVTACRVQIKGANNSTSAYADGLKVTSLNETVETQYSWAGINSNDSVRIATGGSERMRIDPSGNLLVGTTTARNRLTVDGTVYSTPTLGTASGQAFFGSTGYGTMFGTSGFGYGWIQQQRVDGTATAYDLLLQPVGGNVGIGTTTPAAGLQVANGNVRLTNGASFTTANSLIREINSASGSSNQFVTSAIGFNTGDFSDAGVLTFSTANNASTPTERMRITQTGNVGIGTSSVAGRLHSVSTSGFTAPTLLCGDGVGTFRVVFNTVNYAGVPANKPWLHSYDDIYLGSDATTSFNVISGGGNVFNVSSAGNTTITGSGNSTLTLASFAGAYSSVINMNSSAGGGSVITASQSFSVQTNSSERMRITSTGNVGIGTTAPDMLLDVVGTGRFRGDLDIYAPAAGAVNSSFQYFGSASLPRAAAIYSKTDTATAGNLILATAQSGTGTITERIRIDSVGNMLVGCTTTGFAGGANTGIYLTNGTGAGGGLHIKNTSNNTGTNVVTFYGWNDTQTGSILTYVNVTNYNTSSDARLKENIADADDAGNLIDAIQVRKFDWKSDNSHQRYGMVAQELVTVAPEAVSQQADPDDMMGVDYSKLVPMLVKEIQSLRARVAQLEGN